MEKRIRQRRVYPPPNEASWIDKLGSATGCQSSLIPPFKPLNELYFPLSLCDSETATPPPRPSCRNILPWRSSAIA